MMKPHCDHKCEQWLRLHQNHIHTPFYIELFHLPKTKRIVNRTFFDTNIKKHNVNQLI